MGPYVGDEKKVEEIRALIKSLREERGISQREMARLLDLNPGSYNRMENGPGGLKIDLILQIARILEVEPASFLGSSSEEFNDLWMKFQALSPERQERLLAQLDDLLLAEQAQRPAGHQ